MTAHLIKTIICSAFFLLLYKAVFEKERIHKYNRVYLLLSLLFSLAIPAITFTIKSEVTPKFSRIFIESETTGGAHSSVYQNNSGNYTYWILLSIYIFVALVLLLRFIINLKSIHKKIAKSEIVAYNNTAIVLVCDKIAPHSFLNYIFVNRDDYNNGKIEEEILFHELTHVCQKHSIDNLFLEILQIVWWFNPILFFYKKAVQLNHEYLESV